MNSEIFTQIIVTLIMIIGAVVSSYVIPYLTSKVQSNELDKLMDFAKKSVEWANQTIPPDQWERKKNEVMNLVIDYMEKNLKIKLSTRDIDVIVEALVNEAKKIIG